MRLYNCKFRLPARLNLILKHLLLLFKLRPHFIFLPYRQLTFLVRAELADIKLY